MLDSRQLSYEIELRQTVLQQAQQIGQLQEELAKLKAQQNSKPVVDDLELKAKD